MAPAPSEIPEAFPAVTVPSFLKTEGSLVRDSIVVVGRACSSWLRVSTAFLTLYSTGAISALKRPALLAI